MGQFEVGVGIRMGIMGEGSTASLKQGAHLKKINKKYNKLTLKN